ncbi:VanZ family protein [Emticicia sp. 17c]|uniref:VanZ family protein n=1 Tax=Emticicia sp. 17c TaxID=3127704 RepID=UPI00301D01B2
MNLKTIINQVISSKYTAIGISIIIFVLCTLPNNKVPLGESINDKTAHLIAFGGWAFCWQSAFGKYTQTILVGIGFGVFIEIWQGLLPESFYRNFDWIDAVADTIGVLAGIIFHRLKMKLNL